MHRATDCRVNSLILALRLPAGPGGGSHLHIATHGQLQDATGGRLLALHCRSPGGQGQRRIDVARYRVAHYLAAAGLENRRRVAAPRGDADMGKVRDPVPVRPGRDAESLAFPRLSSTAVER